MELVFWKKTPTTCFVSFIDVDDSYIAWCVCVIAIK